MNEIKNLYFTHRPGVRLMRNEVAICMVGNTGLGGPIIVNTYQQYITQEIVVNQPIKVFTIISERLPELRTATVKKETQLLTLHLGWVASMVANDKLLISGPVHSELTLRNELNPHEHKIKLLMLNVQSLQDAYTLALTDPLHENGFCRNTVHSMIATLMPRNRSNYNPKN